MFNATLKPLYVSLRTAVTGLLERRAGIETGGIYRPEQLGFSPEHRVAYVPSGWMYLRRILRKRDVSSSDVFIDFGSGMGRVVYQAAARYPFARVIGVELSRELNEVARANIERARSRLRCREVELVVADVLDYDVPDDVTIAYMSNPFTGPVFQAVVDKLVTSVARNSRRVRVIYLNPVEEDRLLAAGFRIVRAPRGMRPTAEWSRQNAIRMYELGPQNPG
jgi:predicted RNA methylase